MFFSVVRNFLTIAIRVLFRYKGTTLLNLFGLATGIACSILIFLFVMYEKSYDRFHEKAGRIYRVAIRASIGDTKINQNYSSAVTFLRLLEEFPEIETGVKCLNAGQIPVVHEEKTYYETRLYGVDSTFFDVFSFPLIEGDARSVLSQPNSLVLSERASKKYFNSSHTSGKILNIDFGGYGGIIPFTVRGVFADAPENSHFHPEMLFSLTTFPDMLNNNEWTANSFISYLVLHENTSPDSMKVKLAAFTRKYMGGEQFDLWMAQGNYWEYFLQPLTAIHLNSDLNGEFEPNGSKTYVLVFSLISIIILLMACINYVNLTTARSAVRSLEVGIRKVVGSVKGKLIGQFLMESVVMSFLALVLSLLMVEALLPSFRNLVGRPVDLNYVSDPSVIPSLLVLGLSVGLISGFYPAFHLSSLQPLILMKSREGGKGEKIWLRNGLVVLQFGIAVFLIIGTATVMRQVKLFRERKLGFNKEQVLVIHNPASLGDRLESFREQLLNNPGISSVTVSNTLPGRSFSNWGFGAEGIDKSFTLNTCVCDYDFLNTLKLEMAEGRFFSRDFRSDSCAVILNEKAVELIGWNEPLGKRINNWAEKRGDFTVIGVVRDFHYESLHHDIRPMALFLAGGYFGNVQDCISVRFNASRMDEIVNITRSVWTAMFPGKPFEYSSLDEDYDNLYANEKQTQRLFYVFCVIAITIACLGLTGLSYFIIAQKTREICVRKIFGATKASIMQWMSGSFVRIIIIAGLTGSLAGWYFMKSWLQNFTYRVEQAWWVYMVAVILTLVIALVIVVFHTVNALRKNPAVILRYE